MVKEDGRLRGSVGHNARRFLDRLSPEKRAEAERRMAWSRQQAKAAKARKARRHW